jgi:phosphocarrier protein HPr
MSESSATRNVTIVNSQGLHARPAYLFAQLAGQFNSKVEVVKDGERVDGKSILSLLTLAATQGTQFSIEADGPDAHEALDALAALVAQGFPGESAEQATNQR